jgi:Protein of Unknown function (DUF2784)
MTGVSARMTYRALADLVLFVHFGFVLFVILGGVLALRWPRIAWIHLPIALYGVAVEFIGFICPLTPLEVGLRQRGGQAGYEGGFIDHYITAAIYPTGLTRQVQFMLGAALVVLNVVVYRLWWKKRTMTLR